MQVFSTSIAANPQAGFAQFIYPVATLFPVLSPSPFGKFHKMDYVYIVGIVFSSQGDKYAVSNLRKIGLETFSAWVWRDAPAYPR
jgi:hypothetical protein